MNVRPSGGANATLDPSHRSAWLRITQAAGTHGAAGCNPRALSLCLTLVEAHFVDDIKRAIADGSARHVDANRTGRLLLTAATGGAYTALRSGDAAAAADAFQSVLELIATDPQL